MMLPPRMMLPAATAVLAIAAASTAPAATLFFEDLGNFPDAIAVSAEFDSFGSRLVNGTDIAGKTGFLFALENTSYSAAPDPAAAFRDEPDGDFAVSDVLTAAAAAAIGAAQPFGIHTFGTNMHPQVAQDLDSGTLVAILPAGFELNVEGLGGTDPEVNFEIKSTFPNGLLFDDDAPSIDALFTSPRTGVLEFFIETNLPLDVILDATSQSINERGLDIKTEMAWAENGTVATVFTAPGESFNGKELRPRGQLAVPEPSSLLLLALGLAGIAVRRRARR